MTFADNMANWLRLDPRKPELLRAQHAALTTQVPLLYLILIINTVIVASVHYGVVPTWLAVGFPTLVSMICVHRMGTWWRAKKVEEPIEIIRARLLSTVRVGALTGFAFLGWGMALYVMGEPETQPHVIFYIAITSICCITSLMHLPAAALLLSLVVSGPFTVFMLVSGGVGALNISINLLAVIGVLIYVLHVYSRDFARMIDIQKNLETANRSARELSEENHRLANADALTGLYNRRRFFSEFEALLTEREASQIPFAIGLVDLDGFKPINDGFGHHVGDAVLKEVGRRLLVHAGPDLFFARLGGDEFAILLRSDPSQEKLDALAEALCASLRQVYEVGALQVELSGTIGFATFPEAGASVETLYERADYALYDAKQSRRGGMVTFSAELQQAQARSKTIELALARADFDVEMHLEFQPIFDVASLRPSAFEALARWRSPQLGAIPPDQFIRVAERTGAIHKLTRVLLGKALEVAKTWPQDVQLSFNLSMRDLTSREAMTRLIALIERSGFPPHRLVLELTETAFMRDYEAAADSVVMLKRLGVKLSLDDFGAGYSSLSYVHRLPIDKIKIDRSFVRALGGDQPTNAVIRTILMLCENLQLGCIAEGMETGEQVETLRALGCTTMQGFFFSRPVPVDRLSSFFENEDEGRPTRVA
jgi:diguanylate cyclase (GGDEF)-like protein